MLIALTSSAAGMGEAGMLASTAWALSGSFRNPTWCYRQQPDAGTGVPVETAAARDPQVSSRVT